MQFPSVLGIPSVFSPKRFTVCLVFLLFFFAVPTLLRAQISGSISGTVLDQAGAGVPGAKVSLINENSQEVRDSITNDSGYFTFSAVLPSTYTLSVEAKSFKIWKQTGIVMHTGDVRTISSIELKVGAASETVEVNSTLAEIPVDSGAREELLTSRDIEDLPLVSRNISELLKICPAWSRR